MTRFFKKTFRLYLLLLLLPALWTGAPSSACGEPLEPPAAGFVSRNNVNVRGTPSLSGAVVGKLNRTEGEELIVIGTFQGTDGESWYHILSESLGEG
ncbi:MAG: SH3 domain-containing protein [Synergistaceae bacterium]|nr:SH3 domain-containing protein [Synergistaceae bacterium]